jgi:putative integral membrane protein (TIGR02587 family)
VSTSRIQGEDGGSGRTIGETARDHLRAAAGGLLVGLPLLWTMEVWADGAVLGPVKLLVLVGVGFAVVVGFNALAGFRAERSWAALLVDSVQAMGLSVIIAAAALLVLGRLDPAAGLPTLVGRVAIESIPVAFGASLASTVMAEPSGDEGGPSRGAVGPLGRLLVAGAGALYFALNVAPTDEVRILAAEATTPQLLLALVAGLGVGLAIVFHAEFRGGRSAGRTNSPLDHPLGETVAAYALSLGVSLVLLWAFGSTEGTGPGVLVAQVVLLGLVASFGAAGARLIIGPGAEGEAG